jgi:hypothetical protein
MLMPTAKPQAETLKAAAAIQQAAAPQETITVEVIDPIDEGVAVTAADSIEESAAAQVAGIEPTAPAATTDKKSSAAKGRWGIQVGAFNAYEPALNAAKRASKRVAKLVKNAQVVIDETAKGKTTLYRARLVGLTKQNAQKACRQLKAKSIDCLVFQTDVALAMNP